MHGASGGVGSAAVQLARAAGVTVIGTGGSDEGRRRVQELGAHHVVDHHAPDYLSRVRELTGGRGVDVILETLANVNLAKDFDALARHGRIVVIGSRGALEFEPRLAMRVDAFDPRHVAGERVARGAAPRVCGDRRRARQRLAASADRTRRRSPRRRARTRR